MVHSGSAIGGHYYAYIKSFSNLNWYEFNDSTVGLVTEKVVKSAYGGESGANAYMLMYRLKSSTRNMVPVSNENVPQVLQTRVNQVDEKDKMQSDPNYMTLNVAFEYESTKKKKISDDGISSLYAKVIEDPLEGKLSFEIIHLKKDITLEEAKRKIWDLIGGRLVSVTSYERTRLRKYEKTPKWKLLDTYSGREDQTLADLFNNHGYYSSSTQQLFLEYLPNDKPKLQFEEWREHDRKIVVHIIEKSECKTIEVPTDVRAGIDEFKILLEGRSNIPAKSQYLFLVEGDSYYGSSPRLRDITTQSWYPAWNDGLELYLERWDPGKGDRPTNVESYFDNIKNGYTFIFNIPVDYKFPRGVVFDQTVMIDGRKTLETLKEAISKKINLAVDEFKIAKGSSHHYSEPDEFKDMESNISQHYHSRGKQSKNLVYVKKGVAFKRGETKIKFYLYSPGELIELLEMGVKNEHSFREVRPILAERLFKKNGKQINPDCIRFRKIESDDKVKDVILLDSKVESCFRNQYYYSSAPKNCIAIQETASPEEANDEKDIVLLLIRRCNCMEMTLDKPEELALSKYVPLSNFSTMISKKYNISIDNIMYAKPYSYKEPYKRSGLSRESWSSLSSKSSYSSESVISEYPLSLNSGDMVFIRNKEDGMRTMTYNERADMDNEDLGIQASLENYHYTPSKERGLQINVQNRVGTPKI